MADLKNLEAWEPEKQWCKFQSKSQQARDPRRAKVLAQSSQVSEVLTPLSQIWFYPGLQSIGWGPLTLGRATCFT